MWLLDLELKELAGLFLAIVGGIWLAIFYIAFCFENLMSALASGNSVWIATVGTLWLAGLILFFLGGMAYSAIVMVVANIIYQYAKAKIAKPATTNKASQ